MNTLLVAHVIVRTVCLAVIGLRGRNRAVALLFIALALEAIYRLWYGQETSWSVASMWSLQALVDLIVTSSAATVALSQHASSERRRVREALRVVHAAGVRMGTEQAMNRLSALHKARGQAAMKRLADELEAVEQQREPKLADDFGDVSVLLAATARDLRNAAGDDVQVQVDVAESTPYADVDPKHLRKVLLRLGRNSVEAMNSRGRLVFRARPARTPMGAPPRLVLHVQDTGCGMSPAAIERALTPFVTTKEGAVGLGLNVVQAFVDAVGGDFEIDSAVGRGTTVVLTLPARPKSSAKSSRSQSLKTQTQKTVRWFHRRRAHARPPRASSPTRLGSSTRPL